MSASAPAVGDRARAVSHFIIRRFDGKYGQRGPFREDGMYEFRCGVARRALSSRIYSSVSTHYNQSNTNPEGHSLLHSATLQAEQGLAHFLISSSTPTLPLALGVTEPRKRSKENTHT